MQTIQILAKQSAEYTRNPKNGIAPKKEKKPAQSAKDIVNMDSTGGFLADTLAPNLWGGERAGRTQAMADAIGEKTTFNVRHPVTASLIPTVLGGIAGNAAGIGATGLYHYLTRTHQKPTEIPGLAGAMISTPALAGTTIGATLGTGLAGLLRRKEMNRINHFFDEDTAQGKVKPKVPDLSLLSALTLPGRGAHRSGQIEAYNAMKGNSSIAEQRGHVRDGLNASIAVGSYLPGVAPAVRTALLSLLQGYGQNAKTQLAASRLKKQEEEEQANPV